MKLNFVVDRRALKMLIAQVQQAVPTRPGRRCIPAVNFESDGKTLRALASDGYRLAVAEVPLSLTKFPPCEKAFAATASFTTEVKFSAHSLRSVLYQLKPVTDRRNPRLMFEIVDGCVEVSTAGTTTKLVGAEVSGKNNHVSLHAPFVSDFLSEATGEVTMQVVDEKTLVRFNNGPSYFHFIMPLLPGDRKESKDVSEKQAA